MRRLYALTALSSLFIAATAFAGVDLIALPQREEIRIKFHPHTPSALVQEMRRMTLRAGENLVELSWSGIDINPDSIHIALSPERGEVVVESISIRPGSVPSLLWHVKSSEPMEVPIYVIFLTSSLRWEGGYDLVLSPDEAEGTLSFSVKVVNGSAERLENAQVELPTGATAALSLDRGESKRLELFRIEGVKVEKLYLYPATGGELTEVYYLLRNDGEHGLGRAELPKGIVHVYRRDEGGETAFLSEDELPDLPVGAEARVALGKSREVEVRRELVERRRLNVRRDKEGRIAVADVAESYRITVKNHRKERVKVEVEVRMTDPDWLMRGCSHRYERVDSETIRFELELDPGAQEVIRFEAEARNAIGGNIKAGRLVM